MRITKRTKYIELTPREGMVFFDKETGDIAEGACIRNDENSDDIIEKFRENEMEKAVAEELAAAFNLEEETAPEAPGEE